MKNIENMNRVCVYSKDKGVYYILLALNDKLQWVLPQIQHTDDPVTWLHMNFNFHTSLKSERVEGVNDSQNLYFFQTSYKEALISDNGIFSKVMWVSLKELPSFKMSSDDFAVANNCFALLSGNKESSTLRKNFVVASSIFFLVIAFYFIYTQVENFYYKKLRMDDLRYSEKENSALKTSLANGSSEELKEMFLNDLNMGINDKFTKTDAYFITHRFFDNGGNIYEIYDYVNSHEALSFLKEAEQIYPEHFASIKNKTMSQYYTFPGLYCILAYLEVLDRYGYADIAAHATLTNQYSKLAFFSKMNAVVYPPSFNKTLTENNIKKALVFSDKSKASLAKIGVTESDFRDVTKESVKSVNDRVSKEITPHNFLVGVNQYAASLRYLEAYGATTTPVSESDFVFSFATKYAEVFVKDLLNFTGLGNASTLSLLPGDKKEEMRVALQPFITRGAVSSPKGVTYKVITSRMQKDVYFENTNIVNPVRDIYGKFNIINLANLVPDFKKWLMLNGWKEEEDFKIETKK